jgi:hypothetical protein
MYFVLWICAKRISTTQNTLSECRRDVSALVSVFRHTLNKEDISIHLAGISVDSRKFGALRQGLAAPETLQAGHR